MYGFYLFKDTPIDEFNLAYQYLTWEVGEHIFQGSGL